jgi:hypothetical protein
MTQVKFVNLTVLSQVLKMMVQTNVNVQKKDTLLKMKVVFQIHVQKKMKMNKPMNQQVPVFVKILILSTKVLV